MKQIAHRGYSDIYKDNSLNSFQAAIDKKFDCIELDIQLSFDKLLFVYHDTYIKDKLLSELTFQEILKLDSDIITLQQFFDLIRMQGSMIEVYLDIKGNEDSNIAQYLHEFLSIALDPIYVKQNILLGSFNINIIAQLCQLDVNNKYKLGVITENAFPKELIDWFVNSYRIYFLSVHYTVLTKTLNLIVKHHDIKLFTYTNKNQYTLQYIQNHPYLDGVVTNF